MTMCRYAATDTIESDLEFKHFRGDHLVTKTNETGIYKLKKVTKTDSEGNPYKTYQSYEAVTLKIIDDNAKLAWTVVIIAIPVVIAAVLGTVVHIKRKNK